MTAKGAEALLRAAGRASDADIDLARTALAFAALDRAAADAPRYRDHLAVLAGAVAAESQGRGGGLQVQVESLRTVIVDAHGYRGARTTYDDLRNADLSHVIDRRRGLPVALSILWLHAGRAQGWQIHGLNFPGHFLLRVDEGGERAIIDPFNDGASLAPAELRALLKAGAGPQAELTGAHYAPLSNRGILLRLQNNIKQRLLATGEVARAIAVIERMLLLAPEEGSLWHEAARVNMGLENLRAALACFDTARGLAPDAAARQRIDAEIAALRGKLN